MSRLPAVADRFYPGNKDLLNQTVAQYLERFTTKEKRKALAVVSPHAGYIYSGAICAETLNKVEIPETVVILGPNHHGRGAPVSLSRLNWKMPSGDVAVNEIFSDILLKTDPTIEIDEFAHQLEHSLEVQVPFLQALQKRVTIVPLVLSHLSFARCQQLAGSLVEAIDRYGKPVLLLASSDMNHYDSRQQGSAKDQLALRELEALNPQGLYSTVHQNNITMCGIIPVTVALKAALDLGANKAEIIRYADSGDVSGDTEQVVGYAGAAIYKA